MITIHSQYPCESMSIIDISLFEIKFSFLFLNLPYCYLPTPQRHKLVFCRYKKTISFDDETQFVIINNRSLEPREGSVKGRGRLWEGDEEAH